MLVLGIRVSTKEVRYALLEIKGQDAIFINSDGENKLIFPNDKIKENQKLAWLHEEFERILRQNKNIKKIIIKTNEFVGRETSNKRFSTYMDGVFITLAGLQSIPTVIKRYKSLNTNSKEVQSFAASKVGQSKTGWNVQMADAVAAAWSGRK